MAEGEGTSFENPAYEDPWADDNDYGDDTTPFVPNGASTPATGEPIEMQTRTHEKQGLPETSYAETSFGMQTTSERAWAAAKDLFPNMSSSEIDVSYSTKGKLQVKMWGAGKRLYDLFTTEKKTGQPQINKSLPKEIRKALGETKYEIEREQLDMREKFKSEMEKVSEKIKKEKENLESLEEKNAPKRDIDRSKAKIRTLETEHFKARIKYDKTFPSRNIEEEQDDNARQDEITENLKEQQVTDREKIKAIDKQNAALKRRILSDANTSKNGKTPESRKEAKERVERNKAVFERNENEKTELLEKLGTKDAVLGRQREDLQKEKKDLVFLIEEDKKIIADADVSPEDREAAEIRLGQREIESDWNSERLNATERDLGLEDKRPLRERVKEIFKKYGVTVASIFIAAGVTIGAVVGAITNALKAMGKQLANGLKAVGAKAAAALPGLIGAVVSFLFKTAGQAIGFLAEHTWLLILAVVVFIFEKYIKKRG